MEMQKIDKEKARRSGTLASSLYFWVMRENVRDWVNHIFENLDLPWSLGTPSLFC